MPELTDQRVEAYIFQMGACTIGQAARYFGTQPAITAACFYRLALDERLRTPVEGGAWLSGVYWRHVNHPDLKEMKVWQLIKQSKEMHPELWGRKPNGKRLTPVVSQFSQSQRAIMRILRDAHPDESVTVTQLVDATELHRNSITRSLKQLMDRNLVVREHHDYKTFGYSLNPKLRVPMLRSRARRDREGRRVG